MVTETVKVTVYHRPNHQSLPNLPSRRSRRFRLSLLRPEQALVHPDSLCSAHCCWTICSLRHKRRERR